MKPASKPDAKTEVPLLGALKAYVNTHDAQKLALEVFHALEFYAPGDVPPAKHFSDPKLLDQWRDGQATIPEHLRDEFASWLVWTKDRRKAIEENARRLRMVIWAALKLRSTGDYWPIFEAFLAEKWGMRSIAANDNDRERQVMACARNGRTRTYR